MYDARRSMQVAGNADTFVADAGSGIDVASAGTLVLGAATATKVEIADTGVVTEVQGGLTVQGDIDTASAGAMTIGAATATSVAIADTGVPTDIQGAVTIQGDIDTAGAGTMTIGAATATKVEIADTGVETEIQGPLDVIGIQTTASGVGAIVAATGLSLVEQGNSVIHKTIFTFSAVTFAVNDAGAGDEGWGTLPLYTFPAGGIRIMGASSDIAITGGTSIGTGSGSGDFAVGSTASTDESALATTLADIILSAALTEPFVGGAGDANSILYSTAAGALNGTSSAVEAHLNMIFDAGDVPGNTSITLNGTVTIVWINVGDY